MTPLEKARLRAKEPPACKDCPESERVGNVLYCTNIWKNDTPSV
jgi:hypothetical protein